MFWALAVPLGWAQENSLVYRTQQLGRVSFSSRPLSALSRVLPSNAPPATIDSGVLLGRIAAAAQAQGLDVSLVLAVVEVESAFNAQAVSSVGAQGLMQVMPATAARFGVLDAQSVEGSLLAGCRYLAFLLRLFEGDVALALAAYNAGEGAVMRHGRVIPPYAQTQRYVPTVLAAWQRRLPKAEVGTGARGLRGLAPRVNEGVRLSRR